MGMVFTFVSGARAGQSIEVGDLPVVRLGRRPDNDVPFDAQRDLDVSGHHAEIRREADGHYLYDVGSANGTFVDGARVNRLRLASGHQIAFGPNGPRVEVKFVGAVAAVAPPASAAPSPALAARPQAVAPAAPAMMPVSPAMPAAPAAGGPPPAAGQGHMVGSRTVAMMIDQALSQSRQQHVGPVGKSTVFFRSMVNQAVTQSTRRFKVVAILGVALLLGAVGGLLFLRHVERKEATGAQAELRREMAQLMEQQKGATSEEKKKLAERLEQLNQRLAQGPSGSSGKDIVRKNMKAVFLIAFNTPMGEAKGYCTAFAVAKRVLATNAHCVAALEQFQAQGMKSYVVMNREPSQKLEILRAVRHPAYHKPLRTISEDVGLLQVGGDVPSTVELAGEADLKELESGDVMYTYGFPGRLASVASPNATLVQGVVGRVTKLDGETGAFGENRLLQHSAFTAGGTSGSPIFNQHGKVVAVNAGGYVEPGTMQVMDPMTGRASELKVAKQLAGYNFGIRVDVLQELIRSTGL